MTKEQKLTMREAHETTDIIVEEVAGLLGVAVDDILDEYGHSEIDRSVFFTPVGDGGGVEVTKFARRFARELVMRLIYDGPVKITLDPKEDL